MSEQQYEREKRTLLHTPYFYLDRYPPRLLELYTLYIKRTNEEFIFLVGEGLFRVYRAAYYWPLEWDAERGIHFSAKIEHDRRLIITPKDLEKLKARKGIA